MLARTEFAALIPVKKMDRALRFYTKTLGGKVLMRDKGEMKDFWASVRVGKQTIWLVAPDHVANQKVAYNVFITKDIRKVVKGLQKAKVKFDPAEKLPGAKVDGPIAAAPWGSSAFFYDSEKNLLMLWQNS